MNDALVGGHAAARGEDEDAYDQSPEVEFATVSERMLEVRGLAALADAIEHQSAVASIDDRVDRFGEHCGAARKGRGHELRRGDRYIAKYRRKDSRL